MIKLDNNLLAEIGLGALPESEKAPFLKHMYETLELRVGTRLAERMNPQQMTEFEQFINTGDEQGAFQWLEANFPNYKDVVAEEFERLKGEIAPLAPQILAASQDTGTGGAPTQAPQAPPLAPQGSPLEPGAVNAGAAHGVHHDSPQGGPHDNNQNYAAQPAQYQQQPAQSHYQQPQPVQQPVPQYQQPSQGFVAQDQPYSQQAAYQQPGQPASGQQNPQDVQQQGSYSQSQDSQQHQPAPQQPAYMQPGQPSHQTSAAPQSPPPAGPPTPGFDQPQQPPVQHQ